MSLQTNENNPDDLFSLSGSVGRFGDNNRTDVIKAQALLANAGYYDLPKPGMPTGWPGGGLTRAVIQFQKDHGLDPDGILLPMPRSGASASGEGETLGALKGKLSNFLEGYAIPSVKDIDRFYRDYQLLSAEGAPATPVNLDSGSGEPIGVQPVMSDEPPLADREPQAGEQTAYAGKVVSEIAKQGLKNADKIPNLLRGLGILAPAATLAVPSDTPQTDRDALRPPEPAPPEEDRQQQDFAKPQRGRIVIAEDGKELHVPPLGAWADKLDPQDRQIADAINDALAEEMALHFGGGRGSQVTQEGINAALQECLKALEDALPEAAIEHIAGGNPKGMADDEALREEHLWEFDENGDRVRKGSNRSDWTIVIARNVAAALRGNTYDTEGGKITDREANAETAIRRKTEGDQMVMVAKQEDRRSEADIRRDAYKACYDAGLQIRADWTRNGEFEKPKPVKPAEYKGPENARRAEDIRRMRGKQ